MSEGKRIALTKWDRLSAHNCGLGLLERMAYRALMTLLIAMGLGRIVSIYNTLAIPTFMKGKPRELDPFWVFDKNLCPFCSCLDYFI